MKYKVGDRVKIKSRKEIENLIEITNSMLEKCETVMTIEACHPNCASYHMKEDNPKFLWADEMIEGLVEEETNDCEKCGLIHNSTRCLFMDNCPHSKQKNIIEIPEDYVIKDENGNVINATKIVLEKKKKEYPKTYEECCKVLGIDVRDLDILDNMLDTSEIIYRKNLDRLLNSFRKLLICRDAYWKIAGEEMGLGKPWKPNDSSGYCTYAILRHTGHIRKSRPCADSVLLEFPTEEMRDAFYENFKELIEICKELL